MKTEEDLNNLEFDISKLNKRKKILAIRLFCLFFAMVSILDVVIYYKNLGWMLFYIVATAIFGFFYFNESILKRWIK